MPRSEFKDLNHLKDSLERLAQFSVDNSDAKAGVGALTNIYDAMIMVVGELEQLQEEVGKCARK